MRKRKRKLRRNLKSVDFSEKIENFFQKLLKLDNFNKPVLPLVESMYCALNSANKTFLELWEKLDTVWDIIPSTIFTTNVNDTLEISSDRVSVHVDIFAKNREKSGKFFID